MTDRDPVRREALERLRRALLEEPPRSTWLQLATVGEQGIARLRTVVLHDVDDEARLVIATDASSAKVRDLKRQPRAEALLLARKAPEQFRLLARFEVVDAERARRVPAVGLVRRSLWKRMEPREKGYYVSPAAGLELEKFPPDAFKVECRDPEPVDRFCVLLGELECVDALDASVLPHSRVVYEAGKVGSWWKKRSITP